MKSINQTLAAVMLAASTSFIGSVALAETTTTTQSTQDATATMDILSYALGKQIAGFIKQNNPDANIDSVKAGLEDALNGNDSKYSDEEIAAAVQAYQAAESAKAQAAISVNQAKADAFLAENKSADGVMTTESGLQYMVMTEGQGAKPLATDTVSVHYRGTLINGTEFDSSYSRGTPTSFPVNGVIQGWQEGLQLMGVGSKYKFFIPPNLAYGERGAGQDIGPNEALIFEVELLSINPNK